MTNHKDHKTLEGMIAGDKAIVQDFYQKNFVYISSYILQNSGNTQDAEDIFQDAMLMIYQKAASGQFEIRASLRSYFYGVCKNLWRNKLRQNIKISFDPLATIPFDKKAFACTTTQAIEAQDKQEVYHRCFKKLSNASQEVLQLFFEGKSMREISEITGCTEGNTRKRKWQSKNDLQKMMAKDRMYQELIAV